MDLQIQWGTYGRYVGSGLDAGIHWSGVYPPNLGCLGFGSYGSPTPSGGIVSDIEARVTLQARQWISRSILDGTSFKIVEMAVGGGGYDVADPTQGLRIDETSVSLVNEIFRRAIDQIELPTSLATRSFVCRFDQNTFTGGVGELGLYAEILSSPVPAEIGTKFLFAVAHMGLNTKTAHHICTYRVFVTI